MGTRDLIAAIGWLSALGMALAVPVGCIVDPAWTGHIWIASCGGAVVALAADRKLADGRPVTPLGLLLDLLRKLAR